LNQPAVAARDVERASLVDLLDRVIGTGVVLSGDIVISLAGVDLVMIRLRALLTTIHEPGSEPKP
jgi:Gas vesicle protein